MRHGGGRSLEEIRQIQNDIGFQYLLDIDATQIVDVATTIIFDPACNRQDEIKNPG